MKLLPFIPDTPIKQAIIFVILLLSLYFFYGFHNILFFPPQGIHFIRQTDCLSFVIGYYKFGMNFFEPKNLNLASEGGKAVSEFPILYYLTACLYFIFGEKEFILRLLNVSIVSVGFFYLFRLLNQFFQSIFYAYVFSFLFLSSTVLIYYTNNYLPDAPALGFTLIGWYFFNKFLVTQKYNSLTISILFFTLSSLLKITFFMNPITAFLLLLFFLFSKKINTLEFKKLLLPFIISIFILSFWLIFVIYYNSSNHSSYYSTTIHPIWTLSYKTINDIWKYITEFWYTKYYFQTTFHVFIILVIGGLISYKKIKSELLFISLLLFMGGIFYLLLFYKMFQDHDYYFITLLPAIFFLITAAFQGIKERFPKISNHLLVKVSLLIICILSLNYSKLKLNQRYTNNTDDISIIGTKLATIEPNLTSIGVENEANIIIATDLSQNGGLYFLKRQGWTLKTFSETSQIEINNLIDKGANYLIITDPFPFELRKKFKKTIFQEKGITMVKLN